jgi:haloalkane dehalogenase
MADGEERKRAMSGKPYAAKKFAVVNGVRMAYIDEGEGDAIVFQHGNPTSSYLWRNVMPHLEGLGRLVACDLVGIGDSAKLSDSGPGRYSFQEHREYLSAFWDQLGLGDRVVLVLHDWGSALGFDWAFRNQHRVAGIAYMESIVRPFAWEAFPEVARSFFEKVRSDAGETMILDHNLFVEKLLPASILRTLSDEEMAYYREPFLEPGEGRRPTLAFPRSMPIGGEPRDIAEIVEDYGAWLAGSGVPKLFVDTEPGAILTGPARDFCRSWPNQTEVTVPGIHYVQEDSADAIGRAVADFVRSVRGIA